MVRGLDKGPGEDERNLDLEGINKFALKKLEDCGFHVNRSAILFFVSVKLGLDFSL